ncbi:XdhC family protein [Pontixanthobacter sp.]|uniref:XdhC family protein n=1 Tax=Pontixanthobacter sp. TaxID=2792078 RepID=UPI003C7D4BD1
MDRERIFEFLIGHLARGEDCVLVTVLAVEGTSMRDPGAHVAVGRDGRFTGSLSGGCIENAVVAEAMATLADGKPRITRFGAGSRFLDIRLPCGGGLDIHFQPLSENSLAAQCRKALSRRTPFSLTIPARGADMEFASHWQATAFDARQQTATIGHWPCARLQIIGHGAAVESLARLAGAMHMPSRILTPDVLLAKRLESQSAQVAVLQMTADTHLLASDPWTATIFLFHDHEWEAQLMARALEMPGFYIGAMGSRAAHAARCEHLHRAGLSPEAVSTIDGPAGMFHSARNPDTLALSVLAKIIGTYQQCDFADEYG